MGRKCSGILMMVEERMKLPTLAHKKPAARRGESSSFLIEGFRYKKPAMRTSLPTGSAGIQS